MKLICISDTHGRHRKLDLPEGDILIHAGDFTSHGTENNVRDFADWLDDQDYKDKIVIAGNHDKYCYEFPKETEIMFDRENLYYLRDDAWYNEYNRYIYGSPYSSYFLNWFFNIPPGEEFKKWQELPDCLNSQILITHGPPHGVRDMVGDRSLGDIDLRNRVEVIRPKLHIFGHIHNGYGIEEIGGITYINCSVLDESYSLVNKPIVFEI